MIAVKENQILRNLTNTNSINFEFLQKYKSLHVHADFQN